MKGKMLIALAASALVASVAFAEPQSAMPSADAAAAAMQAPGSDNIGGAGANDQQMLSDNSNVTGAQMPSDMGGSDEMTADNATGDDY